MPKVEVVYYQDSSGEAPVIKSFEKIRKRQKRVYAKFKSRILLLESEGKICRPNGDYLRDDIYELRCDCNNGAYRLLYFFHRKRAVVCHWVQKKSEKELDKAINVAVERKNLYFQDPDKRTYG
jgi:phage-related protein